MPSIRSPSWAASPRRASATRSPRRRAPRAYSSSCCRYCASTRASRRPSRARRHSTLRLPSRRARY
eukprot:scaffold44054_cov33-Phaeocystis_antarctica.AAC.1